MKLVLFLLCGGFIHFTFASNRLRIFSVNLTKYNWSYSLNECKKTNGSFVTLYDEEDANFTDRLMKHKNLDSSDYKVWLGLHRRPLRTTWSDNNTVRFRNVTVDVTNGEQRCIAIVYNTWTVFNCSDKKPFMCYKGKNYTLIENKNMSWCQALQYCRNHFIDLVSISNETENQAVIKEGENKTFWIGLMYDEWKWEDNGCSSYRKWPGTPTDNNKNCTYYHGDLLSQTDCQCQHVFCSKGSVRIKVIKLNLTWEEAFDYCEANHTRLLEIQDHQDQEAVEQWLNMTDAVGPFWIALRQSRVFGFWIWSDRAVTVSNWKDGRAPEMPFSQHCGVIETNNYTWRDENCLFQRHFLCEEDIIYM